MRTLVFLLATALLTQSPLGAAVIRGRVTAPAEKKGGETSSYSRGVFMPSTAEKKHEEGHASMAPDSSVVVWAEPLEGAAPFVRPSVRPTMIQQGKQFIPGVLVVQTGTTVAFPNLDPLYHNVFSYSRTKRFDLGRYAEGKSKEVTFDESGVVEVFCEIHENMHAYILVIDSPYFAKIQRNGEYELQAPPGRYRVRAWLPNRESEPQVVDLGGGAGEARADFAF